MVDTQRSLAVETHGAPPGSPPSSRTTGDHGADSPGTRQGWLGSAEQRRAREVLKD